MSIVLQFEAAPGKPVLRGQAYFWGVIRELGRDGALWSAEDVWQVTNGADRSTVRDFVQRLVLAGIAEDAREPVPVSKGRKNVLYRLLQRPVDTPELARDGSPAPRALAQRNMWRTLRDERHGIDAKALAVFSSTEEVCVPASTAKAFLHRLAAAGYLAVVAPGGPNRATVWRLKPAMNTGPKPPMILRSKLVFDANKGVVMGPVEAEEDRP